MLKIEMQYWQEGPYPFAIPAARRAVRKCNDAFRAERNVPPRCIAWPALITTSTSSDHPTSRSVVSGKSVTTLPCCIVLAWDRRPLEQSEMDGKRWVPGFFLFFFCFSIDDFSCSLCLISTSSTDSTISVVELLLHIERIKAKTNKISLNIDAKNIFYFSHKKIYS